MLIVEKSEILEWVEKKQNVPIISHSKASTIKFWYISYQYFFLCSYCLYSWDPVNSRILCPLFIKHYIP